MVRGDRVEFAKFVHPDRRAWGIGTIIGFTNERIRKSVTGVPPTNIVNFTGQLRENDALVKFDNGQLAIVDPSWLVPNAAAQIDEVNDLGIVLSNGTAISYTQLADLLTELECLPQINVALGKQPKFIREHISQHFKEAGRLALGAVETPAWA